MKSLKYLCLILCTVFFAAGCKHTAKKAEAPAKETSAVKDSTVYGVCGDGTAMHTLQLITDVGDTIEYTLLDSDGNPTDVQGGLMAGDRMAVIGTTVDGERVGTHVINMTTLLGKWGSIDKNFEIEEGGVVKSYVKAESHPWTSWKIVNGKLLLNRDTFTINSLGADSLLLENNKGIFAYKHLLGTGEK